MTTKMTAMTTKMTTNEKSYSYRSAVEAFLRRGRKEGTPAAKCQRTNDNLERAVNKNEIQLWKVRCHGS